MERLGFSGSLLRIGGNFERTKMCFLIAEVDFWGKVLFSPVLTLKFRQMLTHLCSGSGMRAC